LYGLQGIILWKTKLGSSQHGVDDLLLVRDTDLEARLLTTEDWVVVVGASKGYLVLNHVVDQNTGVKRCDSISRLCSKVYRY
jgi:hypothetical protein